MKFCTQCGNQLGDEKFCTKCGAPVPQDNIGEYVNTSSAAGRGKSNKNIMLMAIAAVVLVIVVICVVKIFGGGYRSVANEYMEAMLDGDAEKIMSLMPDKYIDYIAEERYDGDRDEMTADLQDSLDEAFEEFEEEGVDVSDISYKIVEIRDWDKEDISDYNENFAEEGVGIKFSNAKTVKIEVTVSADGAKETDTDYCLVAKIGGAWYLMM